MKRLRKVVAASKATADEKRRDEVMHQVYNALANIVLDTQATKKDMDFALDWFNTHFYESDDYDN